jgi:hypothetical protein
MKRPNGYIQFSKPIALGQLNICKQIGYIVFVVTNDIFLLQSRLRISS